MSEIGAVPPADRNVPADGHQPPEREVRRRPPHRPRKPASEGDLVEVEPHKLDVEA
jgi:hypothetical protein